MNPRHGLLLTAIFVVLLLVGSVSAKLCVDTIPSPPYNPKSPQEDIIKVEAYLEAPNSPSPTGGYIVLSVVRLTVTFAAPTPPTAAKSATSTRPFSGGAGQASPSEASAHPIAAKDVRRISPTLLRDRCSLGEKAEA